MSSGLNGNLSIPKALDSVGLVHALLGDRDTSKAFKMRYKNFDLLPGVLMMSMMLHCNIRIHDAEPSGRRLNVMPSPSTSEHSCPTSNAKAVLWM